MPCDGPRHAGLARRRRQAPDVEVGAPLLERRGREQHARSAVARRLRTCRAPRRCSRRRPAAGPPSSPDRRCARCAMTGPGFGSGGAVLTNMSFGSTVVVQTSCQVFGGAALADAHRDRRAGRREAQRLVERAAHRLGLFGRRPTRRRWIRSRRSRGGASTPRRARRTRMRRSAACPRSAPPGPATAPARSPPRRARTPRARCRRCGSSRRAWCGTARPAICPASGGRTASARAITWSSVRMCRMLAQVCRNHAM